MGIPIQNLRLRTDPAASGGLVTSGRLVGSLDDVGKANGEAARASASSVASYMTFRLKDLLRQNRKALDQAMTYAWYIYQQQRGVPRWYTNTESIPKAAMVGAISKLVDSLRVEASDGQPIRVSGSIELNEGAVLAYHNANRRGMTKAAEWAIRKAGANPKTYGVVGSFRALKHPFLSQFLTAGPNIDVGKVSIPRAFFQRGPAGARYSNVFTLLGNRGVVTRRRASVVGGSNGTVLLNALMYALGFVSPVQHLVGATWALRDTLKNMSSGLIADQMRVVMQEVRTKFPTFQFV